MAVKDKNRIPGVRFLFYYSRNINGKPVTFYGFDKVLGRKRIEKSGFTSRKEAERSLMLLIASYTYNPSSVLDPKIKLSELREKWLERQRSRKVVDSYLHDNERISADFIKAIGNIQLEQLQEHHLASYVEGRRRKGNNESTIEFQMRIIRGLLNSAKKIFPNLQWNPPKGERLIKKVERLEPEVTIGTVESIRKALQEMNTPRSHDVADIVLMGATTALRIGEIISLKWANVRFSQDEYNPYGSLALVSRKTGKAAALPLTAEVRDVLLRRYERRGKGELIFDWNLHHGSMKARVEDMFKRGCEKAGIPYGRDVEGGIRFHSLRHYAARVLSNLGVDLATIAAYGRWTTRSMVLHYSKAYPSNLKDAMLKLESTILGYRKQKEAEASKGASGQDQSTGLNLMDIEPVSEGVH